MSTKLTNTNLTIVNLRLVKLRYPNLSVVKMRYLILGLVNLGIVTPAFSDSYTQDVLRLQSKQDELSRKLTNYGMPPRLDFGNSTAESGNAGSSNKRPLYVIHGVNGNLQIPQGEVLLARLVNRLVVGPEGSPVLIELSDNQGRFSGLRVLGKASQGSVDRLQIEFQKLRFRSGNTIAIQGTALDTSGALGLKAEVISQKAVAVVGAMASSFISGFSSSQQTMQQNAFGFEQTSRTGRNAILQGVAQTAADQSKRLIEEASSEKPVMVVEAGTLLTVLFNEEVRF